MGDSIHDDDSDLFRAADSRIDGVMACNPSLLEVYHAGELTVVGFGGFGGRNIGTDVSIVSCRDQLFDLVARHNCRVLAFDLTGVRLIPSGMLGVLVSLRRVLERVELHNPSDDVLEALRVTHLERFFQIHWGASDTKDSTSPSSGR